MPQSLQRLRKPFARRAVLLEIGGFRPPENPLSSWFGRVNVALPGEEWPETDGKPMHALCQINLTECPWLPPRCEGLEMITVFVGPDQLPVEGTNGSNWQLRAYSSLDSLVPLPMMTTESSIKPLPMRPVLIEHDYPCYDDVVEHLPEDVVDELDDDEFEEAFVSVAGFKLGGWPSLIQSEICWSDSAIEPEFVFQIPTTEKGNWMWGDNGTAYIGRGTAPGHEQQWTVEWQCY